MYNDKTILVLGMGNSGIAVSQLLCKNNHVLLTDIKCADLNFIKELEDKGINVVITDRQADLLTDKFDYVIKSPGIGLHNEVILKANKLNIPVINEMEVAYNLLPNVKIVGITGSNGKTTTTYLTYEILKQAGLPVHIGGNMGIALCSIVYKVKENDVLVLEVSSHQLSNLKNFKTDISVFTNLSEVHIDHFGNFDNYKKNKLNIFNHHSADDVAILNGSDDNVVMITENIPSKKMFFNSSGNGDCYIKNDKIFYGNDMICELSDIRIKGMHNYENVMCAILVAKEFDVSNEVIREALANFGGVEHRLEFVDKVNGRDFYNDSKATNNKSTIVALTSFNSPIILLLGGLDRGQSFDELRGHLEFVKEIVCFGETKNKIADFARKMGVKVTIVDDLDEATKYAYNISDSGDTILLSPACASWDQFKSFEERGKEFKKIVESL